MDECQLILECIGRVGGASEFIPCRYITREQDFSGTKVPIQIGTCTGLGGQADKFRRDVSRAGDVQRKMEVASVAGRANTHNPGGVGWVVDCFWGWSIIAGGCNDNDTSISCAQ